VIVSSASACRSSASLASARLSASSSCSAYDRAEQISASGSRDHPSRNRVAGKVWQAAGHNPPAVPSQVHWAVRQRPPYSQPSRARARRANFRASSEADRPA
jgi:hypothetical protein